MTTALTLLLVLAGIGALLSWARRDGLAADHGPDADRAAAHRPRRLSLTELAGLSGSPEPRRTVRTSPRPGSTAATPRHFATTSHHAA